MYVILEPSRIDFPLTFTPPLCYPLRVNQETRLHHSCTVRAVFGVYNFYAQIVEKPSIPECLDHFNASYKVFPTYNPDLLYFIQIQITPDLRDNTCCKH